MDILYALTLKYLILIRLFNVLYFTIGQHSLLLIFEYILMKIDKYSQFPKSTSTLPRIHTRQDKKTKHKPDSVWICHYISITLYNKGFHSSIPLNGQK